MKGGELDLSGGPGVIPELPAGPGRGKFLLPLERAPGTKGLILSGIPESRPGH